MPETSQVLLNDAIRRQVLLEGVKENEWGKFNKFLKSLERDVRERLSREGDTIETKKRLNVLLADLNTIQKDFYTEYSGQFTLDLDDIALTEAKLEAQSLSAAVTAFDSVKPAPEQILAAYKNNALSVPNNGLTLKPFLRDYSSTQIKQMNSVISQGYTEGKTISQITRELRGTRPANYQDGTFAQISRNNRTMVRTAVQNSSTQARQRIWDSNKELVKGVEWVSTLDSRTTTQCRSLDGKVFPIDKGVRPPIHYGCRSTTTPVLSENYDFLDKGAKRPAVGDDGAKQVSTNTTYYSWLKTQPASFQDEVIGKTRGKLLRNGGLTSEQFAELQLNRNFKPRTIEEMEKIAPEAFSAANL